VTQPGRPFDRALAGQKRRVDPAGLPEYLETCGRGQSDDLLALGQT
jgi:hypothetical protein